MPSSPPSRRARLSARGRAWVEKSLGRKVPVHPSHEVTVRSPMEADPSEGGLSRPVVEGVWDAVVRYYQLGLHPGMALCLRRRGKVMLHRSIGHSRGGGPGEETERASPDTWWNLFSASKCVTAMLVHLLAERRQLSLSDPVADWIPAFGRNGKEGITLQHLLSHRAGLSAMPKGVVNPALLHQPGAILDILCDLAPESTPGQTLSYHAVTTGFLFGEVVKRASGRDLRTLLDEEVRQPLGFSHFQYGVPESHLHRVAREVHTGPPPPRPFAGILEKSLGLTMEGVMEVVGDPRFLTAVVPSGNIIGTSDDICRFFELLRCGGILEGKRIFAEETVRSAVAPSGPTTLDRTILLPLRYGMGFMLGGEVYGFYGPRTPQAFGHLGFTNVLAWADPEREISVALMNNGNPFLSPELLLWMNIMRVISTRIPRERRGRVPGLD